MSGGDRRVLVQSGLSRPTALTLDYPYNRLYWVDIDQEKIYTSDLDGGDVKVFIHSSSQVRGVIGLTFYGVSQ